MLHFKMFFETKAKIAVGKLSGMFFLRTVGYEERWNTKRVSLKRPYTCATSYFSFDLWNFIASELN